MLLLSFQNNIRIKKIGRLNLLSEELLKRTKDVIIGSHLAGTVISRRMVIASGTGVVKADDPGTIVRIYFVSERQVPPPSVFKYLHVVNNYTHYRNFIIISGVTKIFATYKSCFYNYTLLHIRRLHLEATEIELGLCFEFFAF